MRTRNNAYDCHAENGLAVAYPEHSPVIQSQGHFSNTGLAPSTIIRNTLKCDGRKLEADQSSRMESWLVCCKNEKVYQLLQIN